VTSTESGRPRSSAIPVALEARRQTSTAIGNHKETVMILDYRMLRDIGDYNRAQVAKSYKAGQVHRSDKLPRRHWWSRITHGIARAVPGARASSALTTDGTVTRYPLPRAATGNRQ
jgi:hypothetical protein